MQARTWKQVYGHLSENVFLRMEDLLKGTRMRRNYRFLRTTLSWSREELLRYQSAALQRLLRHAAEHVPYYQERFARHRVDLSRITGPDQLERIPVLDRKDLIAQYAQLVSTVHDLSACKPGASSGSTGEVVRYLRDAETESVQGAAQFVGYGFAGWRLGARTATVWGNRRTVEEEWSRWGSRVKQRVYRNLRLPAYHLTSREHLNHTLERLCRFKPEYIEGYSGALHMLAREAARRGITDIKPRGVFTTAETLTPPMREDIERSFGSVYDMYGCGEILSVAFESGPEHYRVMEPVVIMELEDIGAGDVRSVILTDLHNYAMPLIRYRVGDLAVPGDDQEAGGPAFRCLRRIVGRTSDIVETPNGGQLVVPSFFGSSLLKSLSIRQYQVAKVSEDRLVIRLVMEDEPTPAELERVSTEIARYLNGQIEYSIELADALPMSETGKFKLVVDETKSSD